MSAPFGRRRATIVRREEVGPYVVLHTDDDAVAEAGQFFMVAAVDGWGGGEDERPFLPRALSTLHPTATFFLDDVGPGTHRLTQAREGEELWLVGPLGGPFPRCSGRAVLVAGGVGVPPIAFLAATMRRNGQSVSSHAGFRDAWHASAASLFDSLDVWTDDGSAGRQGFVTQGLAEALRDGDTVYACGPPGMLEAVRALCVERDVQAWLALESGMACGFGACFGCVVPMADGSYARVCVDGPVIEAAALAEVPAH